MNYKVINVDNKFGVLETKTNNVVFVANKACDANKMKKHLNLGGCFDGFTPNFFLGKSLSLLNSSSENM